MQADDQTRALLQLISEGFVFADSDFRVIDINEAGLRMAHSSRGEYIGRSLWDFLPALEEAQLRARLEQVMAGGEPLSIEHLHTWPDQRQSCLEVRAHRSGGGLAIFYRDVTEQKRSDEELKRAQSELMQASRISAMGTMAATLAHEIAQPLMSVRNYAAAGRKLLRGLGHQQAREAGRAIDLAIDAADRASELLRRLRAFVSKGRVEATTQDLHAIVADAGVLMLPQAQRAGAAIDFELDPRARWVKADDVQIQQVLVNLMRNALEAMAGSGERRIVVAAAPAEGAVEVTIDDTGPGLGETRAETLFAAFQSGKLDGLGVGLSLSRTIVEAHGGTMRAGASPAGGARFSFTLPRAPAPN